MAELIEINAYPVKDILPKLLQDKTTGKRFIYATDYYSDYGCGEKTEMSVEALRSFGLIDIQPRVKKAQSDQTERTRAKAEVFTPTWIVKKMNDHCDSVWRETADANDWQKYVQLRILEITCGEAPFLVTRYDTTTGDVIPIFAEQVYGLAPTEIIHQIVLHFTLDFDKEGRIEKHNLRQFDSLPYAKDGTLEKKLDVLFKE